MATTSIDRNLQTEKRLRDFAATLSEKDRRRFAAIEATQRGHGGITYIAGVLGISTRTIERGIEELDHLEDDPAAGRVRRPGAGRKKIDSEMPEEKNLIQCIEFRTAGDPDEEDIVYTDWSPQDLSDRLSLVGRRCAHSAWSL